MVPPADPPKRFQAGNLAHGRVAVGNVVSGLAAFGNVTHGFLAVGNVAVGVIAIGNVAFGVVAIGATNAIGVFAFSFINAVPGLYGASMLNLVPAVPFGFVALAALLVASFLFPGDRTREKERRKVVRLESIVSGELASGWVNVEIDRNSKGQARVFYGGEPAPFEFDEEIFAGALLVAPQQRARLAFVESSTRVVADAVDYRAAGPQERVLKCTSIQLDTPRTPIWTTRQSLQWYVARTWRAAAVAGGLGYLARVIFG